MWARVARLLETARICWGSCGHGRRLEEGLLYARLARSMRGTRDVKTLLRRCALCSKLGAEEGAGVWKMDAPGAKALSFALLAPKSIAGRVAMHRLEALSEIGARRGALEEWLAWAAWREGHSGSALRARIVWWELHIVCCAGSLHGRGRHGDCSIVVVYWAECLWQS